MTGSLAIIICITLVLANKQSVYHETIDTAQSAKQTNEAPEPFPVSVNPDEERIVENPLVNSYLSTYLAYDAVKPVRKSWWHALTRTLANRAWYQNLASPISRILVIWPGDRREEVVKNFGQILNWDDVERQTFSDAITTAPPTLPDGTFFPGRYITNKDATPEAVASLVRERFTAEILARYPESVAAVVPLKEALTIASLLEREAYAFDQMREISGVIWNRLFSDMPLQLDATLQYVKANDPDQPTWWPSVKPEDKFLSSPFNTYENIGLPPSPIANPSAAAILAALNPAVTDCLYYFHTDDGTMHCSTSYAEHVESLKQFYGRGQ